MDDEKIREIFADFRPEISSPTRFMASLQQNMEAVELVRQHTIALRRRNRIAVAVAAVAGFAMGLIMALLYPIIGEKVAALGIALPHLQILQLTINYGIIATVAMAAVCTITAVNAYEIALAKISPTPKTS